MDIKAIIQKLYDTNDASREELLYLLDNIDDHSKKFLIEKAYETRYKYFKNTVFVRGLIEISSYCKKDCLYCGLRRSNKNAERYRLDIDDILECAKRGDELGYKTIVLQGGEDAYFNDEVMVDIIKSIKKDYKIDLIKKILNYIHENYNDKIYIEDLALEANMNVQYFCRFFKSVIGKTPVEYINSYRIEKATELLQTETLSISNIALSVGIDNFSYFVKQFKKYKNCTPSQYRKSL